MKVVVTGATGNVGTSVLRALAGERRNLRRRWSVQHCAEPVIGSAGMRDCADDATAPLARSTSGPARVRELLTGVGKRP